MLQTTSGVPARCNKLNIIICHERNSVNVNSALLACLPAGIGRLRCPVVSGAKRDSFHFHSMMIPFVSIR